MERYLVVLVVLFASTTLYTLISHDVFKLKWMVLLVLSVLYFNQETFSNRLSKKSFYALLVIVVYILSKWFETGIFYVNLGTTLSFIFFLVVILILLVLKKLSNN